MGNLLKLKAAFAASAVTASIIAGAEAQVTSNSQLLAPPASDVVALVEKTSEREIRAFLEPLELTVTPFDDGDSTTYSMMATTEAGGQFLVTLFGCENPATGEGCEALTSYAGFSNAGLAYDDLNRFNTLSAVSKAVNLADQNTVVFGVQQYLAGGVSADNMQFVIVLFLNDLDNFMSEVSGASTAVSHRPSNEPDAAQKTDNVLAGDAEMQKAPFGAFSTRGAIASAINNTRRVSFSVDASR